METPGQIVVHHISKPRTLSAQTCRDDKTLANRRKRVGEQYNHMEQILERVIGPLVTRAKLFAAAALLCKYGIVQRGPDRLCRRKKEALICWFCENEAAICRHFDIQMPTPVIHLSLDSDGPDDEWDESFESEELDFDPGSFDPFL
jgi:hypothetical protein